MSVLDDVRAGLGIVRDELYHCWECDANFLSDRSLDECAYCGSGEVTTR